MSSDKRIKQFFQLTENNIVGMHQDNRIDIIEQTMKPIKSRTFLRLVLVVLLIGSGVIYTLYPNGFIPTQAVAERNDSIIPKPAINQEQSPLADIEPTLQSKIPALYVAAIRQELQSIPLRKSDLAVVNEMDPAPDLSLVVLDKVIVIPTIHPLKTKEIT